MDKQIIVIPLIELIWTEWISWDELKNDARTNWICVPNAPGVYEVKLRGANRRLIIGKAENLRRLALTSPMHGPA